MDGEDGKWSARFLVSDFLSNLCSLIYSEYHSETLSQALAANTTSPPPPTKFDMVDVTDYLAVHRRKNSARHDKARAHTARTANKTSHRRQQSQRRLDITDE
jgi:hypothetical protein